MSPRPPRHRYIAFRIEAAQGPTRAAFLDALRARAPRASLVQFGGSTGLARCTNFEKEETIAALVAIDHVDGEPVRVTTLGTSGTIRKATEKFLR